MKESRVTHTAICPPERHMNVVRTWPSWTDVSRLCAGCWRVPGGWLPWERALCMEERGTWWVPSACRQATVDSWLIAPTRDPRAELGYRLREQKKLGVLGPNASGRRRGQRTQSQSLGRTMLPDTENHCPCQESWLRKVPKIAVSPGSRPQISAEWLLCVRLGVRKGTGATLKARGGGSQPAGLWGGQASTDMGI